MRWKNFRVAWILHCRHGFLEEVNGSKCDESPGATLLPMHRTLNILGFKGSFGVHLIRQFLDVFFFCSLDMYSVKAV